MSNYPPGSPIPHHSGSTETTRLLTATNTTYATSSGQEEESTIIAMNSDEGPNKLNGHYQVMSKDTFQQIITSGQPTLPTHQLTEKIQDILVFSEIKKKQERDQKEAAVPSNSSSSSSSSSDEEDSPRHTLKKKLSEWSIHSSHQEGGKRLRRRDLAVDALKLATDRWKEKHGWSNSQAEHTHVMENPSIEPKLPSQAESIYKVAKNASVCAVLALLHERKVSGAPLETDVALQTLALSTLSFGLKVHDTSTSHVVLYEMMTTPWMNGKSALALAYENDSQVFLKDARVQLVIEELWKSGPHWRRDPHHPCSIWIESTAQESPKDTSWYVLWTTWTDFLARWCSARYQLWIGIVSTLIYLTFHLATLTNRDFTSDTPYLYEYIYYYLVLSDMCLESKKLVSSPSVYLRELSSCVSFITASLLTASFVIRVFTLATVDSLEDTVYFLTLSFHLVVLATPVLFLRLLYAVSDAHWLMAKASYMIHQCLYNSLWVGVVGVGAIVGFWIALAALQFDDVHPMAMLRFLLLGALHAPEIGKTLFYQPQIAGLLLVIYLFLTVVVLGSLLTASFLATLMDISQRLDQVKRAWAIRRCLVTRPAFQVFLPSAFIDAIFCMLSWFVRSVCRFQKESTLWIEKTHQVLWYVIYSPIILMVGLYELLMVVILKWQVVRKAFHPDVVVIQ
ncbi:hypothetical protein BD560DRAFT_450213 [Blakeslea trispora]|nr:hypothetical protein BD560DRAFT_450213 [Blakeslea trispora]